MTDHVVASEDELGPGERVVIELDGVEIGVYNVDGEYRAYANWCPHQGGPVCEGRTSGTLEATWDREALEVETEWIDEGRVLTCPWHGWEFDLDTGEFRADPSVGLPSYPVSVEDGDVIVSV